jgi:hypothetical protein
MKFFKKCKDGGPESNVDAYVLIEIKSLFSIILLKFNKGSRDNFHSHAFNAITIPLTAENTLYEEYCFTDKVLFYKKFKVKHTPRDVIHRVVALTNSWALTFRGPWDKYWKEVTPEGETLVYTHGRKLVKTFAKQP